jgi:hypothetical protein
MRRYRERGPSVARELRISRLDETHRARGRQPAVGVRKSELEKRLREYGWWLDRQGARHEVWNVDELVS